MASEYEGRIVSKECIEMASSAKTSLVVVMSRCCLCQGHRRITQGEVS